MFTCTILCLLLIKIDTTRELTFSLPFVQYRVEPRYYILLEENVVARKGYVNGHFSKALPFNGTPSKICELETSKFSNFLIPTLKL